MAGMVIYDAHPAMFRAHPFWFLGYIILIPAFGLGIVLLLYWYIQTRQTRLTVTDSEIVYARGIPAQGSYRSVDQAHPLSEYDARVLEPASWGRDNPGLHRRRPAGIYGARHPPSRHSQRSHLEGERPTG